MTKMDQVPGLTEAGRERSSNETRECWIEE